MLIKIQNIEDECAELEEEVEDQKRKIKRMLQDETSGKEEARLQHEDELNVMSKNNNNNNDKKKKNVDDGNTTTSSGDGGHTTVLKERSVSFGSTLF